MVILRIVFSKLYYPVYRLQDVPIIYAMFYSITLLELFALFSVYLQHC